MKQIPLRNRAKEVVGYALVDDADFEQYGHLRWHRSNYGYAVRGVWAEGRRQALALHRLILGLEPGDKRQGDHINRDRLDCRRSNLRVLEQGQNAQNQGANANGRSRYRGVCWHKRKRQWMAYSYVDRKIRYLGYFSDEDAAGKAASDFRRKYMPFAVEDVAA